MKTLSYVEFKLWNVYTTVADNNTHIIVFKADMIECLTGAEKLK